MNNPNRKQTFYCEVPSNIEPESFDSSEDSFGDDVVDATVRQRMYADFEKIYPFGDKSCSQDYLKLRQYHIKNKTLFRDKNFSPRDTELTKVAGKVIWKRPFEIVKNPEFIVDGISRYDTDQGSLGDCWFIAAIADVIAHKKLFSMVVPEDQSFTKNYAGIFHFRFWQYGRWVDVVIDDKLPTINNKLIYLHSTDEREFWPSLLEKAYAKFYGSYRNIEGGQISEALEDLCGGLSEFYYTQFPQIYEIMEMSFKRLSFLGCCIVSSEIEGRRPDGLVTSHAYSINDVQRIRVGDSDIKLLRLRNPWANSDEWNGNWSDNSKSWDIISKSLRDQLRTRKDDGEFWMEISDFQRCFTFVDICHPNPSSVLYEDGDDKNWNVNMFEGSWVPNVTAGGGLEYTDTFPNNPQYHVTIRGNGSNQIYAVIIGLMQKDRRNLGEHILPLELNIFKVKSGAGKLLDKSYFSSCKPVVHRPETGARQLTLRVSLPAGKYCIIPSTGEPNIYACFLLRIYSEVISELSSRIDALQEHHNAQTALFLSCNFKSHCAVLDASLEGWGKLRHSGVLRLHRSYIFIILFCIFIGENFYRENDEDIGYSTDPLVDKSNEVYDIKQSNSFMKITSNRDEFGWYNVQKALNRHFGSKRFFCFSKPKIQFSKNTCKNIIALWDVNCSGRLDFQEFEQLLNDVAALKAIFKKFDVNNSGKLEGFELRNLLTACGYKVNREILVLIMLRYGTNGHMSFENFVICAFKLKTMIDEFHRRKTIETSDQINFNRRDWLHTTLYS